MNATLAMKKRVSTVPAPAEVLTSGKILGASDPRRDRDLCGPAPNGTTRVTIEYCEKANYRPVAQRLAAAIGKEFEDGSVETELVRSQGGVYEVSVDGHLVFSKKATWRLPDADEIFYHVRAALNRRNGRGR